MSIEFLNAGVFTTIQDRGRMAYQRFGFHVAGAMDKHSYELANALLDNDENEACLEFCVMGPMIRFHRDCVIAVTGGNFGPTLNDAPVSMYRALQIKEGDVLKFGFIQDGVWGYVSIAGGIDVPQVMGSRSTDVKSELGGYQGRKLANGDVLSLGGHVTQLPHMERRVLEPRQFKQPVTKIRVVLGPQDDHFTYGGISTFLSTEYTVTPQCDRMGYRLEGMAIEHNELGADIISDGIAYGSIQVPSQGQPIVLLSDRQTTGGYTKIATVIGPDIPKFVQRKTGEKIVFEAIPVEEAQSLYLAEFAEYEEIRKKIRGTQSGGLRGFFRRLFGKGA